MGEPGEILEGHSTARVRKFTVGIWNRSRGGSRARRAGTSSELSCSICMLVANDANVGSDFMKFQCDAKRSEAGDEVTNLVEQDFMFPHAE